MYDGMKYFIFNNVKSTDYDIVIEEMPSFISPLRDIESIEVAGRNGNLHIDNGTYKAYDMKIKCIIMSSDHIDDIKALYSGIGKVEFSDNLGVVYDCVVSKELEIKKKNNEAVTRSFELNLEVNPIGLSKTLTTIVKTATSTFTAIGNYGVAPIIEVIGSGTVVINLNGTSFTLSDCDATAYVVNCDLQNVTKSVTQANDKFVGDFPKLVVGTNTLTITGTVTSVTIKYYGGWL